MEKKSSAIVTPLLSILSALLFSAFIIALTGRDPVMI